MHRMHVRFSFLSVLILASVAFTPSQSAQRGGWVAPSRPAPPPYTPPRRYSNPQPIPRPPPANDNRRIVRPPANNNAAPRSNVTQFPRQAKSSATPLPRVGVSGLPRGNTNAFTRGRSIISLEKKRAIQNRLLRLRASAANRNRSSGSAIAGSAVGGGGRTGMPATPGGIGGDRPPPSITPKFNAAANQPRSNDPVESASTGSSNGSKTNDKPQPDRKGPKPPPWKNPGF
jgi:hypothetical protein